jgi:hypothetical protein
LSSCWSVGRLNCCWALPAIFLGVSSPIWAHDHIFSRLLCVFKWDLLFNERGIWQLLALTREGTRSLTLADTHTESTHSSSLFKFIFFPLGKRPTFRTILNKYVSNFTISRVGITPPSCFDGHSFKSRSGD